MNIHLPLPACNCRLWRPATFHISILGISRSALVGVALDSLHPSSSLCHRFWSLQEERSRCHLNSVNRGCVYLTEVKIFPKIFFVGFFKMSGPGPTRPYFIVHTPKLCWILEVKFGSRLSLFEKIMLWNRVCWFAIWRNLVQARTACCCSCCPKSLSHKVTLINFAESRFSWKKYFFFSFGIFTIYVIFFYRQGRLKLEKCHIFFLSF